MQHDQTWTAPHAITLPEVSEAEAAPVTGVDGGLLS